MNKHTSFLKAIILNPTRLGRYVHTYQQVKLIYYDGAFAHPTSYLWELTAKALPALVNLKHLCIVPLRVQYQESPPPLLVKRCTFKLQSLIWAFTSFADRTRSFVKFLRTQNDLVHLEVGGVLSLMQDFSWLPDDVCPSLMSASCVLGSRIARRQNVVGLRVSCLWFKEPNDIDKCLSELCRLKYLSFPAVRALLPNLATIDCNIILLELTGWDFSVQWFPSLPNLRVLGFVRHSSRNIGAMWNAKVQLTIESFRQCPKLEYVVMEDKYTGTQRRYKKLSVSRLSGGPDSVTDLQSEDFSIEPEPGKPWWTAYGV